MKLLFPTLTAPSNHEDENSVPKWLSFDDMKLLQKTGKPDVTVAVDRSGNYKTIFEAVAAAPSRSTRRYIIRIKDRIYKENMVVPKKKINLIFLGDGQANTIITGGRNVVDGSKTFYSAIIGVAGDGFLAMEITFHNSAGHAMQQPVALRGNTDRTSLYQCAMMAYQDTLYVCSHR